MSCIRFDCVFCVVYFTFAATNFRRAFFCFAPRLFEFACKLLRTALAYEGLSDATMSSPKGVIKSAYETYDFIDEDLWLSMLEARNELQHIYDARLVEYLVSQILNHYIAAFEKLDDDLQALYGVEQLREW